MWTRIFNINRNITENQIVIALGICVELLTGILCHCVVCVLCMEHVLKPQTV